MILVDTSVWIDHLRGGDERLRLLLTDGQALTHPFVIGELALGNLRQRTTILTLLGQLPAAPRASEDETVQLIDRRQLFGLGIGYVDAHLLASVLLLAPARLWTRDKRLRSVASRLGVEDPSP